MSRYLDDTLRPAIRHHLLVAIGQSPSGRAHEYHLRDILDAAGYAVSQDLIHGELQWLQEQALLELQPIERAYIAEVTQRGADVAEGRARVDGVRAPRPGR